MVYHYRTVHCPNCGCVADQTRTVDSQELKGSPFRVCPHCKEVYYDSAYHEPAISVYEDKGGEINFWALVWILLSNGLVIFFIVNAIKEGEMLWAPFLFFLVIALVFDFGAGRAIYRRINAQIYHQKSINSLENSVGDKTGNLGASMERMSSKAYLDALKAHGVYVPDYFYERLQGDKAKTSIHIPDSVKTISSSMVELKSEETLTPSN